MLLVLSIIIYSSIWIIVKPARIPEDFSDMKSNISFEIPINEKSVKVGMIGDVLLHNPLYTYPNYDFAFESVKDEFTAIDFMLANQESLPGGVELGLSGYPNFNSPKHIVRDLKANGIDMLSISNNHSLDKGVAGLLTAINNIKEYDMPYVGAYVSEEDRLTNRIVDIEGIRIGVLAYTTILNGYKVPEDRDYLIGLIEDERVEKEISQLRPLVDVVVVSVHWGEEYQLKPSENQKEIARKIADAGADIIFGHHPHVLQPFEKVGNASVFYSLGNFYSAQQFDYTAIGGIARVTIELFQIGNKSFTEVVEPSFLPTNVVKSSSPGFYVSPMRNEESVKGKTQWATDQVGVPSWPNLNNK